MSNTHTLTVSVADTEIEVEVEFTCSPYIPEQGPTYSSGGQPAEGGEVEVSNATVLVETGKTPGAKVERHPAPWLVAIIQDDSDLLEDLRNSAEDEEPDWDAINDARRERDAA